MMNEEIKVKKTRNRKKNFDTDLHIKLSSATLNRIKERAKEKNISYNKFCRELIEMYLENN